MNGKCKPKVRGGQPGSYYAALGGKKKRKELDMDSSEYWRKRAELSEKQSSNLTGE